MIVASRSKLSKLVNPAHFVINGKQVIFVKKYNHLGYILDNEMSLIPMCKNVEKRIIDKVFMLKKLRRYITYKAALQIYKQTILPIFDYCGFLLLTCTKEKKHDFQIIQNDVLRFCENKKMEDRVTIENLHKKANLLSLEQRRIKQDLALMYKLSKNVVNRKIHTRETRAANKYVFRIDSKIGNKYINSPFYKGTKLWDNLPDEVQKSDNIFLFKQLVGKIYKTFDKNCIV